jgi:hypothetical protein
MYVLSLIVLWLMIVFSSYFEICWSRVSLNPIWLFFIYETQFMQIKVQIIFFYSEYLLREIFLLGVIKLGIIDKSYFDFFSLYIQTRVCLYERQRICDYIYNKLLYLVLILNWNQGIPLKLFYFMTKSEFLDLVQYFSILVFKILFCCILIFASCNSFYDLQICQIRILFRNPFISNLKRLDNENLILNLTNRKSLSWLNRFKLRTSKLACLTRFSLQFINITTGWSWNYIAIPRIQILLIHFHIVKTLSYMNF